uniref:DNA-directed RNA polymerase III subunit n=1 Tax=Bracon brevicornis TaxID=1563983 RepID=A0A6V7L165_9HYME
MAGRGRGRGGKPANASFDPGQIGLDRGEQANVVLQPPMKYPPLEFKAPPMQFVGELSYLVQLKRDYAEHLFESPKNVQDIILKKDIERYSDRYREELLDKSGNRRRSDLLSKLPEDLRPDRKRKGTKGTGPSSKKRDVDIEKKLQELEKKETNQVSDEETEEKDDEKDKDEDEEAVEDEEQEVDEEMDDGTDYVNNYFDNGEGFEDSDDNLDDGPIY